MPLTRRALGGNDTASGGSEAPVLIAPSCLPSPHFLSPWGHLERSVASPGMMAGSRKDLRLISRELDLGLDIKRAESPGLLEEWCGERDTQRERERRRERRETGREIEAER